ncbi:hypothetical protein P1X14_09720 [Sphingomonas sp. AOB5]|uniref:hypothetical protein n=1 Tax=Sphingomonas sp. AOB5 TaxID=3034017 RepID=UPI0023F77482|nr:hypothetical protein [Sphingomonas sp. AOB5]MDF7775523.1 hypothetical protein [Sphingomonas sp. AOB5]
MLRSPRIAGFAGGRARMKVKWPMQPAEEREDGLAAERANKPAPLSLHQIATLSGEELILRYGRGVQQQLIDMIVIAIRHGEDDEVKAIDGRLREVEALLTR